jgi:hypothetical protein
MKLSSHLGSVAAVLIGTTLGPSAHSRDCDEITTHGEYSSRETFYPKVSDEFYALPIVRQLQADRPDIIPLPEIGSTAPITPGSWVAEDASVRWLTLPLRHLHPWLMSQSHQRKELFNLYTLPQAHQLLIAHMDYLMNYTKRHHKHLYPGVRRMAAQYYATLEQHRDDILRNTVDRREDLGRYLGKIKGYEGELSALLELPNVLDVSFGLNASYATRNSNKKAKEFFEKVANHVRHALHTALQNKQRFNDEFPNLARRVASLPTAKEKEAILISRILGEKEFDTLFMRDGKLFLGEVKYKIKTLNLRDYRAELRRNPQQGFTATEWTHSIESSFEELAEIQKLTRGPHHPYKALFDVAAYFPNAAVPEVTAELKQKGIVVISGTIPLAPR